MRLAPSLHRAGMVRALERTIRRAGRYRDVQDTELFLSLAGIAGVFVGFGALIAVRSGGASEAREVAYLRTVMWMGLMVIVAALAPVTLSRYGLAGHELWLVGSLLIVAQMIAMWVVNLMTTEMRESDAMMSRKVRVVDATASALVGIPILLAVVAILLGLLPEQEAALYLTVMVLILLGAGYTLLELAYSQRRPARA
jgi:hypothetical protein